MKIRALTLAVLSVGLLQPALAQDNGKRDWDKIVLEDKNGNVMTSVGGDYTSAQVGQQLTVGEHMMLSGQTTKARVVYYDLDDKGRVLHRCVKDYTDPNTYIIDASCVGAAAWANGARPAGAAAGIIAGAAVIGAALIGSEDNTPISTGSRP